MNTKRMCEGIMLGGSILFLSGGLALAQAGQAPMGSPQSSPQQQTPMPGSTDPTAATMSPAPGQSGGAMADKDFVKEALQGGMAEVQLGQLALQKSSNPDVKQFAQRMVDDHTKLGEQMKPIAQQLGVKPPDGLSKKHKELYSKLQNLNGDAFDKAYVQAMLKDHQHDESAFRHEAQMGADPNVKQAAGQGEHVISAHLQMIKQIAKTQGVTGKGGE